MPNIHSGIRIFFILLIKKFLHFVTRKSTVLWKSVSLKQNRVGNRVFKIQNQKEAAESSVVLKSLAENSHLENH